VHFGEHHSQLLPFCEYVFVPGESPVEVQSETFDILLRKVYAVYVDWGQVSLRVLNVAWTDLDSLAFILHLFNHFYIAHRLICSFCEAMSGSLSMASTAVSSANVGVVDNMK
jgi:hypothetical protein